MSENTESIIFSQEEQKVTKTDTAHTHQESLMTTVRCCQYYQKEWQYNTRVKKFRRGEQREAGTMHLQLS